MRNTLFTIAAGLFLSASSAAFADYAEPMAAQPVAATSSSERLVCHMMVHQGMLLKTRTCMTQKRWDEERRREERDFATFQMRTYSAPFGK